MTSDATPSGAPTGRGPSASQAGPGSATVWWWRYGDTEGGAVATSAGPSPRFPAQAEAESWVGESWQALLAAGIDTVTLIADDDVVYGPMSLHPVAQ